jgi:hypothetical protein
VFRLATAFDNRSFSATNSSNILWARMPISIRVWKDLTVSSLERRTRNEPTSKCAKQIVPRRASAWCIILKQWQNSCSYTWATMNDRPPIDSVVATQEWAHALLPFFEYIVITVVRFQRQADINREGKYKSYLHCPLFTKWEVAQKPFEPSDGFFDVRTYGSNGFMSSG